MSGIWMILCQPLLVLLFLQTFDATNFQYVAERNPQTTKVMYYVVFSEYTVTKSTKKENLKKRKSLERLFPWCTEDNPEQTTLNANQSSVGYKRARDVARPTHNGTIIAAKPQFLDMIPSTTTTGLKPKQPLLARLDTIYRIGHHRLSRRARETHT